MQSIQKIFWAKASIYCYVWPSKGNIILYILYPFILLSNAIIVKRKRGVGVNLFTRKESKNNAPCAKTNQG